VLVSAQASKADIEQAALNNEAFIKQANGAAPTKIIVVPGRLVNLVL
jgi:leucyl-tRNA synthetase